MVWRGRKRKAQIRFMLESRYRDPPSLYVADLAGRSDGEVVQLGDDESRHARSLRLGDGAEVALTDGMGTRRLGRLGAPVERRREVMIEGPLPANEPLPVELAIAVGNRTHAFWLVEKAAEFGIRRISPIETERSRSVSDAGRSAGFWDKAGRRALAAVKQSSGAWLPEIRAVEEFPVFVARVGRSLDHGIVLDVNGEPLRAVLPVAPSPVVLLVGPEGGLTRAELDECVGAGFRPARLGPTILRFETAAVAALAVMAQEREMAGHRPENIREE